MLGEHMEFPPHKTVSIDKLIPYALNSRTHSDAQIDQIAASIKEFGFLNPIIVDGENGIIAGHGRVMAAKKLGLTELPVIQADHLSDAQRKAYVIADNRLAMNAGWDDELLKIEIESLQETDFNLNLLGWEVLPSFTEKIDYSILDDDSHDQEIDGYGEDVKKAIQIEFESSDYDEAKDLIAALRKDGAYIGGIILNYLRKV